MYCHHLLSFSVFNSYFGLQMSIASLFDFVFTTLNDTNLFFHVFRVEVSAQGLTELKSGNHVGLPSGAQGPLPSSPVVGRVHFLAILSLRAHFPVHCQLGSLLALGVCPQFFSLRPSNAVCRLGIPFLLNRQSFLIFSSNQQVELLCV